MTGAAVPGLLRYVEGYGAPIRPVRVGYPERPMGRADRDDVLLRLASRTLAAAHATRRAFIPRFPNADNTWT